MKTNLKIIKESLQETIDIVTTKHYETDFGDGRKKEAETILKLVEDFENELREHIKFAEKMGQEINEVWESEDGKIVIVNYEGKVSLYINIKEILGDVQK